MELEATCHIHCGMVDTMATHDTLCGNRRVFVLGDSLQTIFRFLFWFPLKRKLGPPVVPLKQTTEKSWYPYSNLSNLDLENHSYPQKKRENKKKKPSHPSGATPRAAPGSRRISKPRVRFSA